MSELSEHLKKQIRDAGYDQTANYIDNNCIEVYKILASPGKELAEISKIMACPAECPAISDTDGYTVRAVKCFVQGFHLLEKQVNELRTRPATLDAGKVKVKVFLSELYRDPPAMPNDFGAWNGAVERMEQEINSGNLGVGDI